MEVGQVREMMAFMLVGAGLDRNDRSIATAQTVDRGRADAARGRPAGDDHVLDRVPDEQSLQRRLNEGRRQALRINVALRRREIAPDLEEVGKVRRRERCSETSEHQGETTK